MIRMFIVIAILLSALISTFSCGNNPTSDLSEDSPSTNSAGNITRAYLSDIEDSIDIYIDETCKNVSAIVAIDKKNNRIFLKRIFNNESNIPSKENLLLFLVDESGSIKYPITDKNDNQLTPPSWNKNTIHIICTNNKAITDIPLKNTTYQDENGNLIPDDLEYLFRIDNKTRHSYLVENIYQYLYAHKNTRFAQIIVADTLATLLEATVSYATYLIAEYGPYIVSTIAVTYIGYKTWDDIKNLMENLSSLYTTEYIVRELNRWIPKGRCTVRDRQLYHCVCDNNIYPDIDNIPSPLFSSELFDAFDVMKNFACVYLRYRCATNLDDPNSITDLSKPGELKNEGHIKYILDRLDSKETLTKIRNWHAYFSVSPDDIARLVLETYSNYCDF